MSDDGVLGEGGDLYDDDAYGPGHDDVVQDNDDHADGDGHSSDEPGDHPFGEEDRNDSDDRYDPSGQWAEPGDSTETAGGWHEPDEMTDDDVVLPILVDDPSWAGGDGDIAAVFDGASAADLLGSFEDTLSHGSSIAIDEFYAAVAAETAGLDELESIDGYVTPSTLGEPE